MSASLLPMTLLTTGEPRTASFFRALRDGAWLTGERARIYCGMLLAVTLVVCIAWVVLSQGDLDRTGKPIGTDFASFWTASQLALCGHPAQVYDLSAHHDAQTELFGQDVG
jgi:alpha-1,2-mannosyltransferase